MNVFMGIDEFLIKKITIILLLILWFGSEVMTWAYLSIFYINVQTHSGEGALVHDSYEFYYCSLYCTLIHYWSWGHCLYNNGSWVKVSTNLNLLSNTPLYSNCSLDVCWEDLTHFSGTATWVKLLALWPLSEKNDNHLERSFIVNIGISYVIIHMKTTIQFSVFNHYLSSLRTFI